MRHAKGDRVFETSENGCINAEVVLAYAQRQLAIGFEQLKRRDRDATIAKRFELKLLEIERQSDSPVSLLRDEPRWRI